MESKISGAQDTCKPAWHILWQHLIIWKKKKKKAAAAAAAPAVYTVTPHPSKATSIRIKWVLKLCKHYTNYLLFPSSSSEPLLSCWA